MRLYLTLIVFIFPFFCTAQQIELSPIKISNQLDGNISNIGHTIDGRLLILNRSNNLYVQTGKQISPVNRDYDFPEGITDISMNQDVVYYIHDGNLWTLNPENEPKILEKNVGNGCFYFEQDKLYCLSNTETYELTGGSKIPIDKSFANYSKQFLSFHDKSHLRVQNQQLIWENSNGKIQAQRKLNTFNSSLSQGKWKELIYLLDGGYLSLVNLNKSFTVLPIGFPVQESWIDHGKFNNKRLASTASGHLYLIEKNLITEVDLGVLKGNIDKVFKFPDEIWIQSRKKIYQYKNKKVTEVDFHSVLGQSKVLSIRQNNGIISVLTDTKGILQARLNTEVDDLTWVTHPLNAQIKSLHLTDITISKGQLMGLSTTFGIANINRQNIDFIQLPSGSEQIADWFPNQSTIFIKTNKGKLYELKDNKLSPIDFDIDEQWTIIESQENSYILTGLSTFMIQNSTISEPFQHHIADIDFEEFNKKKNLFVDNNQLVSLTKEGIQVELLSRQDVEQDLPIIRQLKILTSDQKQTVINYPFTNKLEIQLQKDQWPIHVFLEASWKNNPENVEFAILQDAKNLNDANYSFNHDFLHNYSQKTDSFFLAVKAKEKINIFQSPIFITEDATEEIQSPFWLYVSGILGISLIISYIVNRVRRKSQEQKIEQLDMVNRTLELEQKSLQLQMNPHFIFNALNGIQGMIALGDNKKARQYISKLSSLMRKMLDHSRSSVVSIRDEINMLQEYMQIEEALHDGKFTYSFDIPASLDQDQKIPPMMIQPFLENAIKHAFQQVDYQGLIKLKLVQKGRRLQCTVEDNGQGLLNNRDDKNHQSVALDVIKTRLHLLNQGTSLQEFSIQDKSTLDPLSHGVIVNIIIPLINE